jgi:glucosamine--fructose-6-phosphate aminotransferase (isomerizing)
MTTLMRDEIGEIPEIVERVLREGEPETREAATAVTGAGVRFVSIVGRGTSDHAAVYARYLVETMLGIPTGLAAPSVHTAYGARLDWRGGLVLSFSQSGEGPDVVAVTEAARAGGALTVAITNEPASPLAVAAEHVLLCRAGRERAVAASKTYVAQLVAVAALVSAAAPDRGLEGPLHGLARRLETAIEAGAAWLDGGGSPVGAFAEADRSLVVSRGFNLATALEIALKLKETGRSFADGYSTADLLHGPVVLAASDVPILAFRPPGPIAASIDEGLDVARRAGARVWTVGSRSSRAPAGEALELGDDLPEALTPIVYVVPGQLLAERVARERGFDPDAPVGLSKVTRTR